MQTSFHTPRTSGLPVWHGLATEPARPRRLTQLLRLAPLAALLGCVATGALAQSGNASGPTTSGNRSVNASGPFAASGGFGSADYSLLPYTTRGYVGINLGRSHYETNCGLAVAGADCDNPNVSGKVYTGGMFNDVIGLEIGYLHMGRAHRAGGRTDAQGINVSVVGRVPLGGFNVFAKGGATYGRTHVDAVALSGVPTGVERGWGGSFGVGVGYDINNNSSVVLEWEKHHFEFAGVGRQGVRATTVGYKYRF